MAVLDIDAGRLTARLVLEAPEVTDDGQGGAATAYLERGRVWALIEPRALAKEERGPGLEARVTHHVTLRAGSGIAPGFRLSKGERRLLVEAARDLDETGRFTLALCREVTG
ncbi:head-tail adaptor protein [Peteryoungia ipomoeae]|uniref:Head-tail adaptor protein n=1 Tax=Peteryoungia ipomoeae TaxID=1210932 RepID=A0A4S8NMJ3_9HYPH|nr:head-tail adaptor protein [Peteryoungia ipomoeae]THV18068.1 head-tail adaptor protein [Peteryoungia ipomoeae]